MSRIHVDTVTLGPLETNCYLVGDDDAREAVVIDPGAPDPSLDAMMEGWRVRAVVLTHAHWDHFGGAPHVIRHTKAPLLLGKADLDLYRDPSSNLAALLGPEARVPEPDRLLEPGATVEFGDVTLTVAHAPGHSPGGIILKAEGIAFTGDTIFAGAVGRTDLPGGSGTQLAETLEREILSLPDETILYPGHGPETSVERERRFNPFLA